MSGQQELTAAQKKKLKKKAKEKEKKKGGGAEGDEEGEEGAEAKKGKKPGKQPNAAVKRLQEELERKRIAEEERQRAEEERIRQVCIQRPTPNPNSCFQIPIQNLQVQIASLANSPRPVWGRCTS